MFEVIFPGKKCWLIERRKYTGGVGFPPLEGGLKLVKMLKLAAAGRCREVEMLMLADIR